MPDEHIARVLKMLEEGKISAHEAETLIAALRAGSSSAGSSHQGQTSAEGGGTQGSHVGSASGRGATRSFEFRWSRGRQAQFDLGSLGRQIAETVSRINPEKIVREARLGGKRVQDWMREWTAMWPGAEQCAPSNVYGMPAARETETRELGPAGVQSIVIENEFGSVELQGGSDALRVEIVREAWAPTEEEAAARLQALIFRQQEEAAPDQETARQRIWVEGPEEFRDGLVSMTVHVPDGLAVQVAASFGDLRAQNVRGTLGLKTASGGVTIAGGGGSAHVESVSGDVMVSHWEGPLRISTRDGDVSGEDLLQGVQVATVSGDVRLRSVEGGALEVRSASGNIHVYDAGLTAPIDITVESVSGDARVEHARGNMSLRVISGDLVGQALQVATLRCSSVSGDIDLSLEETLLGSVEVGAVSGDIRLALPSTANFRYALSTRTGDLQCEHPAPDAWRSPTELRGTVGTGAGNVVARTVSGDVYIAMIKAAATAEPDSPTSSE